MGRRILFVCTGNTCRSPMAEVLATHLLPDDLCTSAGLAAQAGQPASVGAVEAMARRGFDLKDHQARMVDREMLSESDLVLCLTSRHRQALIQRFPALSTRIHVLRSYSGLTPEDVPDPFGGNGQEYEGCAAQIEEALVRLRPLGPPPRFLGAVKFG